MSERAGHQVNIRNRLLDNGLTVKFLQINSHLARALSLSFALVVTLILCVLFWPSLYSFEERVGNWGWTLSPESELEERITIVAIDEKSIASVGPWPWPREKMAQLVSSIDAAGAQMQLHDIVYSESKIGDQDLIAAFTGSRGVVISQVPGLP